MSTRKSFAIVIEFVKAQLSSIISTIVDFVATALLFYFCAVYYMWSTFLGAITGGVVNCIINYCWTFRGNGQSRTFVVLRYCIVWAGSILLNTWGTSVGARFLSNNSNVELDMILLAKLIVAVLVAIFWNFLLQKFFVYRKR